MLFTKKKCIGCGTCIGLNDEEAVRECPSKAKEMSGRLWSNEELKKVIEKETKVMKDSGGGVTFSGGEPLLHFEYLLELLDMTEKMSLHRCVDTSLYARQDIVIRVAENCELMLVDLKMMDDEKHKYFTGVSNSCILDNIKTLSGMAHLYWVRIPLIKGVNADEDNINASAQFLASLDTKPEVINILPYHNIGLGKLEKMSLCGLPNNVSINEFESPSESYLQHCVDIFDSYGLSCIIGG